MRMLLMVCILAALVAVAGTASAAVQVPDKTLASFGLTGMQPMTDVQGTSIRGMGFGTGWIGNNLPGFLTGSPSGIVIGAFSFGAAFAHAR